MPIYEYRCSDCAHEFELLLLPGTTLTPACPECESAHLERLPTGFAVNSSELSQARVKAARAARKNSKNFKDEKIAESEHIREHVQEHAERVQNSKS